MPASLKAYGRVPLSVALATSMVWMSPVGAQPPEEGAAPAAAAADQQPDTTGRIEQVAAKANVLFKDGRYREAVAAYLDAYKEAPVGVILYNIAYIYDRKLNEPALARDYYRRYVAAPDAEEKTKLKAFERLQALGDEGSNPNTAGNNTGGTGNDPGPTGVGGTMDPDKQGTSDREMWGYISAGVGGVALLAGGIFALSASGTNSDFDSETDPDKRLSLADDGRSQALIADIAIITGLVAGGIGAWLLFGGDDAPSGEEASGTLHFGVAPASREGGVGAFLGGSF